MLTLQNDKEYKQALAEYKILEHVPKGTPEFDRLIDLCYAIDEYEENVLGKPS